MTQKHTTITKHLIASALTCTAALTTPALSDSLTVSGLTSEPLIEVNFGMGLLAGLLLALPILIMVARRHHNTRQQRQEDHHPITRRLERSIDLLQHTAVGTWEWDISSGETRFNERWANIVGYQLEELSPTSIETWMSLAHPDDLKKSEPLLNEHFEGKTDIYQCEARMRHKDGSWVWVLDTGKVVSRAEDGKPLVMTGIHQDITALKRAESAARSNQRKLDSLMSNLPGIAFRRGNDQHRAMQFMSRMSLAITGYTPDEIINDQEPDYTLLVHPQCREKLRSVIETALENHVPYEVEYRLHSRAQGIRWVLEKGNGIWNKDGSLQAIEGFITDVTDLKNTTRVLSLREHELRETQRIAQLGSWSFDVDSQEMHWSDEMFNIVGLDTSETPPDIDTCRKFLTDESWAKLIKTRDTLRNSGFSFELELEIVRSSKELGWISAHGEISRDSRGNITGLRGAVQDISKRKHAELDRERFSKRLAQATKMETVGQLTGGIAHDFNNLLAVILGNLELIEPEQIDDDRLAKQLQSINRAARRGADLTQQLLGFSRKQPQKTHLVKINDLIHSIEVLIARSLTPAITLNIQLDPVLWLVRMDPGEFQDALLNLATNAFDAMPNGGQLSITTRNTELDEKFCHTRPGFAPGRYVLVSIRDNGCGIPAAQLDHIFEPFFTTKEAGKGTGLGLSMVFGFMQRNHGRIIPASEPGKGTTIDLYFPRAQRDTAQTQADWEQETREMTVIGGTETILIVDDEEDLLKVTAEFLRNTGYHVFTASNGREALSLIESTPAINMLLCDLVLPGELSGIDVIKGALAQRPELKLIVTTGANSEEGFGLNQILHAPATVLYKPHRFGELARKIREVFETSGSGKIALPRKKT
jgi:PAS domain S-box-containing protein